MNKCFSVGILILAGLIISHPVYSATYDLSGTWQCTFSGPWASGDEGCAPGPNPSSSCTIEQTGDSFSLVLNTACDPAFTCTFNGTVTGSTYTGTNSGPLEGGGTVENLLIFAASSMTEALGYSTSQATFPEWECTWGFTSVILTRGSIPDKYKLTVNVTGSGSVELDPEGGVYNAGTLVTLTAIPDSGWQFASWAGDAEGSENCVEIVMDEDKTVSAVFTRLGGSTTGALNLLLGD
jgi:hypothetical protein